MEDQKPFRAIIVGGGLVGLTAAHIFSKADIDFVLLEKHENVTDTFGTTLAFWPQAFRIFSQLGLLQSLKPKLHHIERSFIISPEDASVRMMDELFGLLEKNHGHPIRTIHRPHLIKILYENLPRSAKARMLTKKRVVDIDVSEDGVRVVCADGSTQEGSIVIGADGVRSTVRDHLQARRLSIRPEDLPPDEKNPYMTTYRLYFSATQKLPGLDTNTRWDASDNGRCAQIVVGTNMTWFGVYEQLDTPTPESKRYTEADKEELRRRWADVYMGPGLKFRDVDAKRNDDAGLIDLQEGLVDTWFWKRIVLVGDAVRKMEPHAGLGYNCGVMDVVTLANALRELLQSCKEPPSTQQLESLFSQYQADRADETQTAAEISSRVVRYMAWPSWKERFMSMYVMRYTPLNRWSCNHTFAPFISQSPVLEWLDERDLPAADVPWKHHPFPKKGVVESKRTAFSASQTALVLLSAFIVVGLGVVKGGYGQ